jgi:hypothetical protein
VPIYFAGPLFSEAERSFNSRLPSYSSVPTTECSCLIATGSSETSPAMIGRAQMGVAGRCSSWTSTKSSKATPSSSCSTGACVELGLAYAHKGLSATQKLFVGLQTEYRAAFLGSELTSAASLTVPRTAKGRGTAPTGTPITRTGSKGKGSRWTRDAPISLASAAVSASERRGSEVRRRRGRHGRPPNPRKPPRRPPHRDWPRGPRR